MIVREMPSVHSYSVSLHSYSVDATLGPLAGFLRVWNVESVCLEFGLACGVGVDGFQCPSWLDGVWLANQGDFLGERCQHSCLVGLKHCKFGHAEMMVKQLEMVACEDV